MSICAPIKNPPAPGFKAWGSMVEYRLRKGYGVEDIAIALQCKPDRVREHVQMLRDQGVLAKWWRA